MNHVYFLRRCLDLAEQGRGAVGINPMVGAVLVRNGEKIAEDYHRGFGALHAEVALLTSLEGGISPEDVLYVNLEPCCTEGKTPPCTSSIIDFGVKHVVYGMKDPNPGVSGKGIQALLEFGVSVEGPVLPVECARVNRGFVSLQKKSRPWVTLKKAYTRAREISKPDGSPINITSEEQDEWSHRLLRAKHDAIVIGVETVVTDDPVLTVRNNKKLVQEIPQPYRIILDPHLRVPDNAKVISEKLLPGTIIVTCNDHSKRAQELQERGVRLLEVGLNGDCFDMEELMRKLITPDGDYHGISSILVEGGAKTWKHFQEADLVDEEVILVGSE